MNKAQLIDRVSEDVRLPKRDVSLVADRLFDAIYDAITRGATVKIRNFGTFKSIEREERTGVNPRTKESIQIPASKAIKFVAATQLVEELNG